MSIGLFESVVVGNLGKDPELSVAPSGVKVCRFSVAVNRKKKGEEVVTWVNVVTFDKQAELATQYLSKGSRVLVRGDHEINKFIGRDGAERASNDIVANKIIFLDSRKDGNEPKRDDSPNQVPPIEDDLPF